VLGKILPSDELGVYTIAFFLSQAVILALQQLSGTVLFPVYTKLAKLGISELRKKIGKIRQTLMLCSLPIIWAMAIWGRLIVEVLYDERYIEAGWMLQILAIRAVAQVVMITMQGILLAHGDSFRHMILQLSRVLIMGIGMYIGFVLGSTRGILIGMTVASFVEYPIMTGLIVQYGVWQPRLDMLAFGLSSGVIFLGMWLS
jgi:O-antigen/teichoic acid export membrane protein